MVASQLNSRLGFINPGLTLTVIVVQDGYVDDSLILFRPLDIMELKQTVCSIST